jgi:hypothetical protein
MSAGSWLWPVRMWHCFTDGTWACRCVRSRRYKAAIAAANQVLLGVRDDERTSQYGT